MNQHFPDRALKHREIRQPNLFRVRSRFCTPAIAAAASSERQNRQDNRIVFIHCICTDAVFILVFARQRQNAVDVAVLVTSVVSQQPNAAVVVGAVFVSACTHCID